MLIWMNVYEYEWIISCFDFSGDKNKVQKLVQMAWTFVNDRLDFNSFIHSLIQSFPTIVLYQNVYIFCPHDSVVFQLLPYMHRVIIMN